MASPRAEMVLLREALEGVVAPEVATALLFDALERSGKSPPISLEETRAFASHALADAIRHRESPEHASEIIERIDAMFERAIDGDGVAVDVEVDEAAFDEEENPNTTMQMRVVKQPVPVVALGAGGAFAERLTASLGAHRVQAVGVSEAAAFRKAIFSYSPLIVIVDGTSPAAMEPSVLTEMLRTLPDSAMPVLWGADTGWSRAVLPDLEAAGIQLVTLVRSEGIEPLLDLVLARYRGEA